MKKILLTMAVAVCFATGASAQLVTYNLTGAAGDQASQPTASVASNTTASVLSRGSGVTASAAGDSISSTGWSTGVLDLNDYYSFTITPNAGFTLDLGTLSFAERRSGTGIRDFSIRTSLDGFVANIFTAAVPDNTSTRDQAFAFGSTFDEIASALTIRIYGFNSESAAGTWRLANNTTTSNVQLSGAVTAVPEPHEYALGIAGLVVLVAFARRRRMTA